MFSKWKRIAAILAAAVLPVLAALWSAVLSKLTTTRLSGQTSGMLSYLPYIYVGVICCVSAASAYYTHLKPARDLEKPVLRFLALLAEKPLKLGERHGIGPRMNLMIMHRPWFLFGKKRVSLVWSVNMDSFPDVRFKCYCDQGVIGQALKTSRPVLADCSVEDKSVFNFTPKQLQQTSHVKAVWSWPIYEIDGKGQQTGEVIGILNLDGTADDSFKKIASNAIAFEKSMKRLAEVASTIV